jgi:hypothetical protein
LSNVSNVIWPVYGVEMTRKRSCWSLSGTTVSAVFKAFQTVSVGSLVNRGDPLRERVLAELSRGLVKRVGREPYLVRKESPLLERGLGVV